MRFLLVACILLARAPAQAQLPITSSGRDSAVAAVLSSLPPRAEVRVRTSGFPIEGRVDDYAGDTLVVIVRGAEKQKLPLGSITELDVRQRHTAHGAAVGAVTVGVVFGLLSTVAVSAFCDLPSGCHERYPRAIVVSAGFGAGVGALVGAGIGSLSSNWRRVFP
jgi:hypothetical protein